MPSLTESLEKRIQQLQASIETQQKELAAYQHVLALERGTPEPVSQRDFTDSAATVPSTADPTRTPFSSDRVPAFNGNKTAFVAALVQARGNTGATPKEIDQDFAQSGISKGQKLIYRALSSLVKQRKLKKQGDCYVAVVKPLRSRPGQQKRGTAPKTASRARVKSAPPARAEAKKVSAKKAAPKAAR